MGLLALERTEADATEKGRGGKKRLPGASVQWT